MEIQQLRHLLAAAENSNYAQAARACFTSRQNIAHSIKAIESEFATNMFERKGNEMVLTPAGRQMAHEAKEIVARVDRLNVLFADHEPNGDVLDIAVSTNLFAGIPDKTSLFFAENSDKLRFIEMECEACYDAVRSGKADAALVMCMERSFPECSILEATREVSYVIADVASPLAVLQNLSIRNLKDQKLMLMSKPTFQYEPLFAQLDTLGFDRKNTRVITSTSSMIHLMKGHGSVGLVSERFSKNPPVGSCAIPIADPRLHWHFYLLFQKNTSHQQSIMKLVYDIQETFAYGKIMTAEPPQYRLQALV